MSPTKDDMPREPGDLPLTPLDPLQALRDHPEWFFASEQFEWGTVVGLLVSEATEDSRVQSARVRRDGDWVAVVADADWLRGDLEAFAKPTFFAEGGPNATRVEALLSAFCDSVFTASRGRRNDIRAVGRRVMPPTILAELVDPTHERVVVFRRPDREQQSDHRTTSRMTERLADAVNSIEALERAYADAHTT